MQKNKIPLWDNKIYYSLDRDSLLSSLLAISDYDFQLRVWAKALGPEVDWYVECMTGFDEDIDYLKFELREKKINMTNEQIRAILRLHAMCLHFDRHLDPTKIPKDWCESEMHIINHPYWDKVRKQAQYALSLFRKE